MIEFSSAEREILTQRIVEFFLDFLTKQVGPYYYNCGLYDAQAALMKRFDDVKDAIYQMEQPTEFTR